MPPRKKFYTDLSSVLILLSTFAGAVTLSTQFTVPDTCSHSRARALLAHASQFFLACPIGLFTIFMSLHGIDDQTIIESGRHAFIRCQFAFVGLMLSAGFLLLNLSILYTGARFLGPGGATMTALFILSTILWSVEAHMPRGKERVFSFGGIEGGALSSSRAATTTRTGGGGGGEFVRRRPGNNDEGEEERKGKEDTMKGFLGVGESTLPYSTRILRWLIFVVLFLEFVGILVLLGLGISQVLDVERPEGCQLV